MSKENQRERKGKVYELAFANLNENLFIPSSKTGCSWRNLQSRPVWGSLDSPTQKPCNTLTMSVVRSCSLLEQQQPLWNLQRKPG